MGFNVQKELALGSCKDTSAIIRWKEEYISEDGDQIFIQEEKKIEDYFLLFQYFILKDPKASADAKKEKVLKIEGRIETVK